jgi:hypothetical protein
VQKYIRLQLVNALKEDFENEELDECVERGMNSRLCDLEDTIDITQWVY